MSSPKGRGWPGGLTFRARNAAVPTLGLVVGSALLLAIALYAFGGPRHLFQFSAETPHKLTSLAMLRGGLRLHPGIYGSEHDDQVYNGATFTNFGLGLPLLELPFHALVRLKDPEGLFPDRTLYFLFLTALVPTLWTAVHAFLSPYDRRFRAWAFSWSVTLVSIAYSLFLLMSFRFIQYEMTIAFMVVFELFALAFYLRHAVSGRAGWVAAAGGAAAMATVIRPTAALYLVMWGALFFWPRRSFRLAIVYVLGAAPLLAFWLYGNTVKAGGPLALGYQNTNVWWGFQYAINRFGSQCVATPALTRATAWALFQGLFFHAGEAPPELASCRFLFELRTGGDHSPYFSPVVLFLLVGTLVYHLTRRSRLERFLPHVVFATYFAVFARGGLGFCYRYVGHFWPSIVVAGLFFAREARLGERTLARDATTLAATFATLVYCVQDVAPYLKTIDAVDAAKVKATVAAWRATNATPQPPRAARFTCGDRFASWAVEDGLGLGPRCELTPFSNLYLGVPLHARDRRDPHALRFALEGAGDPPPTFRVFVNGRTYEARREGETYVAAVVIDDAKLFTPVVVVGVEWSSTTTPPAGRLAWIEIT